jgi:hypothetical protein
VSFAKIGPSFSRCLSKPCARPCRRFQVGTREELVKYFESSPGFHRGFCSICGSPIVNRPHRTPELGIALGGLDDDNRTLAASGPLSPLGDIESQEEHSGQHIRMVSWQGIANR